MRIVIVSGFPLCRDAMAAVSTREFPDGHVDIYARTDAAAAGGAADLLIFDLPLRVDPRNALDEASSLEATRRILVSVERDLDLARLARGRGFHALLAKTEESELWGPILQLVAKGGEYFPCIDECSPPPVEARRVAGLSSRQGEVLRELVLGRTNKEIATALGISVATVKLHVQSILAATGARNRTEVAVRFRDPD